MGIVHRIVLPGARSLRIEPSTMIPGAVRVQCFAEQGREVIDLHLEPDTARVFEVALQTARVQSGAAKLQKLSESLKSANSENVGAAEKVSRGVACAPELALVMAWANHNEAKRVEKAGA